MNTQKLTRHGGNAVAGDKGPRLMDEAINLATNVRQAGDSPDRKAGAPIES